MQNTNNSIMKPAVIDQILLWMVLFIGFVTLLFLIIDYSTLLRLKNDNDTLAQQGARMKALGRTDEQIATSLNNIRNSYYQTISGTDITCNDDDSVSTFQVIFNVSSEYTGLKVLTFNDTIESRVVAFNEVNSNQVTCTLSLTPQ